MLRLSGFADEISPDLNEQIATCQRLGITDFELRGVDNVNVLKFEKPMRERIKAKLDEANIGVISIGSPCGKRAIDEPRGTLLDQFKTAIDMAIFFESPLIRVFSFYPERGEGKGPIEPVRERAIELLHAQADLLSGTDITMVHENERGIYGDNAVRCLDLMQSVNHPKLRTAFDFANFVQVGQDPLVAWPMLKPYTAHIHVKDATKVDGKVVPAGKGDGQIAAILADAYASGYRGFLSLEPHLKVAAHSHGETGPELFATAVEALRRVCRAAKIPLAS